MSKLGRKFYNEEVILVRPHVTEKASMLAFEGGAAGPVYTFKVAKEANKQLVANAIKKFYAVTPVKVNISNVKSKSVNARGSRRGKPGRVPGFKKAMVTLKKGDKIEFV